MVELVNYNIIISRLLFSGKSCELNVCIEMTILSKRMGTMITNKHIAKVCVLKYGTEGI